MPLKKGYSNFNANMAELMDGKVGPARMKAIKTLAKKKGISVEQAKFKQALAITGNLAKKTR